MSENNPTLRKSQHSIKGSLSAQNIDEEVCDLLETINAIRCLGTTHFRELEPGSKPSVCGVRLYDKALEFSRWLFITSKGGIHESEVHDFVEDLSEVAHLIFHY